MIVKCKECEKEYEVKFLDKLADFQCECGGDLRTLKIGEANIPNEKNDAFPTLILWTLGVLWLIGSITMLFVFFPIGILGFIILVGFLFDTSNKNKNKNMINCPDCGKQISAKAEECPKCGSPLN